MASLGSSTRSAARATSSAYRRLPIRWRLAGGSAALTLVILCGFASIVGVLTTRRIQTDFNSQVAAAPTSSQRQAQLRLDVDRSGSAIVRPTPRSTGPRRLRGAAGRRHPRRHLDGRPDRLDAGSAPDFGRPVARTARGSTAGASSRGRCPGHRAARQPLYVQYARRLSDVGPRPTACALPGLRRARRRRARPAGRPGDRAARDGADRRADRGGPRDRAHARPVRRAAAPGGRRRGRRAGAHAGGDARARSTRRAAETEAALARQREFVADASHELRTPLTCGAGQPRAARGGARRASSARRRRPRCARRGACAAWSPTCCCSRARTPAATPRTAGRPLARSSPRRRPSSSRSPATTSSPSTRPPA